LAAGTIAALIRSINLRKHNAANFRAVGKKLYAPLDPWFNKSSRPGEIELVK
jgi:hypothetical protein